MSLVKMEWTGLLFSIAYAAYLVLEIGRAHV